MMNHPHFILLAFKSTRLYCKPGFRDMSGVIHVYKRKKDA